MTDRPDRARRWPAEWEEHQATLVAWPHNKADWPGKFTPIPWVYAEIVRWIARHERALVVVESTRQRELALAALTKAGAPLRAVDFLIQKTDRSWMRDSAPAFVRADGGELEAVRFTFNGWAKYDNWRRDRHLAAAVARTLHLPIADATHAGKPVVLEGGAIDGNGRGTLITTEECLLHPSVQVRNPGFTRDDYEAVFAEYLGVRNVIWLGEGIAGDDTHGHVDDLCRFVNPTTVVLCREKNDGDANHRRLEENLERLRAARLEDGTRLTVVELPMPSPVTFDGTRLPASYANFVFTNGALLVPTFNDANDRVALGILQEVLPDRQVVGIHAVDLVWGLGTLHCLSQAVPKAA